MSCYHPLLGTYAADPATGERKVVIQSLVNVDYFNKAVKRDWKEIKSIYPDAFLVPCGKCLGCRMDYSRKWADRMMLELATQKKGMFLTLTYDCRHLVDRKGNKLCTCNYPWLKCDKFHCPDHSICVKEYGSVYKPHHQTFMKVLRERLRDKDIFLRFYAVGEYGSENYTHRPHMHSILFGICPDDFPDKTEAGINELGQVVYTHPFIQSCWPHGFISFGDVTWRSCAYVSRYVTKKVLDPNYDGFIEEHDLEPMFTIMSRRPGIGREYLEENPDCLDYQSIYLSSSDGAKKISIPRYYVNTLKLTDPEKYNNIMAQRTLYAEDSMMSKLSQTDLPLLEYLEVEEKNMFEKIKSLKRSI